MPIQLDITDADSVRMAAASAGDVTLLINNAGSSRRAPLLDGRLEDIRAQMDTHYFGTLSVVRAFAPVLLRQWRRRRLECAVRAVVADAACVGRVLRGEERGVVAHQRASTPARTAPHSRVEHIAAWHIAGGLATDREPRPPPSTQRNPSRRADKPHALDSVATARYSSDSGSAEGENREC